MSLKGRILLGLLVLCAAILAIALAKLGPVRETSDDVRHVDVATDDIGSPEASAGDTSHIEATPDVAKDLNIEYASVSIAPGYAQRVLPGEAVLYAHVLTNTGSVTDTYALMAFSAPDWRAVPVDPTCSRTPLTRVQLTAGMTRTVGLMITGPTDVPSGTGTCAIIAAASLTSDTVRATAADTAIIHRVPGVTLSPGQSKEGTSGAPITFTHSITNTGPVADLFGVEAVSLQGWAIELLDHEDPGQTLASPLRLGELEARRFVVGVRPPDDVPGDCSDQVEVTATSLAHRSVMTKVTDQVEVRPREAREVPPAPSTEPPGPPLAKLGVDFGYMVTDPGVVEYDIPLTKAMGADWIRVFLRWRDIEPSRGEYEWEQYDPVFDRIEDVGMRAIVTVHAAPDWAAEQSCGPISDTVGLESFLDHLVPRYAGVTGAWEFINEPDGRGPHAYGPAIGCWGLDPEEYARQLQVFHSKIRDVHAGALVVFGGLAYDSWYHFERGFFERTLQSGAGPYFDAVSLHFYPINPADFPTMAHKINEIRSTMTRNSVYGKRIWVTETGMWVNRRGNVEQQRDFIVQELTRGFGAGADNIFWFDPREHPVGEGVHRWLISADHEPINGYDTFRNLASRLQGLYYLGPYKDVPSGIEAHRFSGQDRSLYILWSSGVTTSVSIPSTADAVVTNRDGEASSIAPADSGTVTVEVGARPLFVETAIAESDPGRWNLRDGGG